MPIASIQARRATKFLTCHAYRVVRALSHQVSHTCTTRTTGTLNAGDTGRQQSKAMITADDDVWETDFIFDGNRQQSVTLTLFGLNACPTCTHTFTFAHHKVNGVMGL